jgi:hypothetical protein
MRSAEQFSHTQPKPVSLFGAALLKGNTTIGVGFICVGGAVCGRAICIRCCKDFQS